MYAGRRFMHHALMRASQQQMARVLFAPTHRSTLQARARIANAALAQAATAFSSAAQHSSLVLSHASPLSSSGVGGGSGGSVRFFSAAAASGSDAAAGGAAAAASGEDDEGRVSAPVAAAGEQQGRDAAAGAAATPEKPLTQAEMDEKEGRVPESEYIDVINVDPYPPEKLAALEKKYSWVDWNAMAHHLHMGDVHFFDQEVPYTDQDFTIKPDFRLIHRLEGANRLKRLQEHEDKKITRLLDFGYWVTNGSSIRVASEGKVRSVWTMVVAGDRNGTASFGIGKGIDSAIAARRAMQDLRRNMLFVPMFESRTISHEIEGRHGVCKVRMWPRPREAGMTAGLIPRMIFECFGIQDITAKVDGRALRHHQVFAIFNGLREVKNLREEAIRRGVTAHRMFERGLHEPRHPGREELDRRGQVVSSLLREIRAQQTHDQLMLQLDPENPDLQAKARKWAEPDILSSPIDNPNKDANTYVAPYITQMPEPLDQMPHVAAPKFPNSKRPPIKEHLMKRRGLPHPKTPQTMPHTKLA